MQHMAHFAVQAPWRLWGHILGGPLALALAPLQIWTGFRARWPALHRWSGRVYGLAVLVAGLAALSLAPISDASLFARLGFFVLALLWLGTTGIGIWAALQGHHARHRWWMQRSLALTFAAVTLRVMMAPLMAAGWTVAHTYDVTAWGSWVLNLVVLEWAARTPKTAVGGVLSRSNWDAPREPGNQNNS
ncbi:MAG: DUF2306 domain-containing protein [Pseudorhodobacter sp.]|nr:DUF2306 domain-containing protein [Pseudorhodobacter sp.]